MPGKIRRAHRVVGDSPQIVALWNTLNGMVAALQQTPSQPGVFLVSVAAFQTAWNDAGGYAPLIVDGLYGNCTEGALVASYTAFNVSPFLDPPTPAGAPACTDSFTLPSGSYQGQSGSGSGVGPGGRSSPRAATTW